MSQACFHIAILRTFHLGLKKYHVILPSDNHLNNLYRKDTAFGNHVEGKLSFTNFYLILSCSFSLSCYVSAQSRVIEDNRVRLERYLGG